MIESQTNTFYEYMHRPENVVEQMIDKECNEVRETFAQAMSVLKQDVMNSIFEYDD